MNVFRSTLIGLTAVVAFQSRLALAESAASFSSLDPGTRTLVSTSAELEVVYHGSEGDSFEGPVWIRKPGYLLFTNVPSNLIYKWTPGEQPSVYLNHIFTGDLAKAHRAGERIMSGANGATLDRQGRLVFTSYSAGEIVRIEKNGRRTVLAREFDGKRINAPNDVVVKSDGSVYFTDSRMATEGTTDPNCGQFWLLCGNKDGLTHKGVYFTRNGSVHLFSKDIDHPNGVAFSPDEKILYVSNSMVKNVLAYDMQPDGTGTNERVVLSMKDDSAPGLPDGIKLDKKGNIYCSGPGGVWIISPDGRHLGTINVPERVTNFVFGGSDARMLYIESATTLYRIPVLTPGFRTY